MKIAYSLDTMSTLSTTTLALRRVIRLYQGPLLEYPLQEQTMNPLTSKTKVYLIKRLYNQKNHEH